jgi:hypothetical protein
MNTSLRVAWVLAFVLVSQSPSPVLADPAKCDTCQDLCRLMDDYLQKEKGIELWRQYAASTPAAQRRALPAGVTDTNGIENLVWNEFSNWAKDREQNKQLPCKLKPLAPGQTPPAVETDLVTVTQNESCEIQDASNGKKLEGQTRQDFEQAKNCKVLSDAVIGHESVHQEHCMRAYLQDRVNAPKILDTPENVAESELQAWTRHKEIVGEGIRRIAGKCGWQPTKRQRQDMMSVPSPAQTRNMQSRGWKAAKALGAKGNPP